MGKRGKKEKKIVGDDVVEDYMVEEDDEDVGMVLQELEENSHNSMEKA